VTAAFGSGATGRGLIGIPFRLVVRCSEGTFAYCRIVPLGDRDRLAHPLPSARRDPALTAGSTGGDEFRGRPESYGSTVPLDEEECGCRT